MNCEPHSLILFLTFGFFSIVLSDIEIHCQLLLNEFHKKTFFNDKQISSGSLTRHCHHDDDDHVTRGGVDDPTKLWFLFRVVLIITIIIINQSL